MPSFELSKLQGVSAPRALSESDRAQLEARNSASAKPGETAISKSGVAVEVGAALDTSTPPVNDERVAEIKQALKDGSYPLVPTQIADAIIAARVGFGVEAR
jgi:negative regulator of flagellin synthesis FlgM